MLLLQYDFERKRINGNELSELSDKESEDNDIKKPHINNNKPFNFKWLSEFSWLRYDENKKRMYCVLYIQYKKNKFAANRVTNISKKLAIRKHTNTKNYNDVEKLEKARIQIESLQKQFFSSNANTNHIIDIMRAVYFLAKKNLPLKLLSSIVELIKESGSPNIFNSTITYTNQPSENEFLKAISHIIEKEI